MITPPKIYDFPQENFRATHGAASSYTIVGPDYDPRWNGDAASWPPRYRLPYVQTGQPRSSQQSQRSYLLREDYETTNVDG